MSALLLSQALEAYRTRVIEVCRARGWELNSKVARLGFHVLEAAELCEALRGKDGGDPADETADCLFTLLAMAQHVDLDAAIVRGYEKMDELMVRPEYDGEEIAYRNPKRGGE